MSSTATSKTSYLKVRFRYGSTPTDVDYTNWTADVGTYVALPAMQVTGLLNSGGLDSKGIEVEVPAGIAFFDDLVDGRAAAPVFLFITEVCEGYGPSGSASEELLHAIGDFRLERAYKNPDRKYGFVRLVFAHHKARSKIPLGIAANPQCAWTLGDKSCQATVVTETGTISAIDRKKVTLTNPTDSARITARLSGDSDYWHRGVMSRDGLSIGIRLWVDNSYDFELVREPPASWLGAVVTLRPGCAKSVADCTTKFSNIVNFGGMGIAIPSYNPVAELS